MSVTSLNIHEFYNELKSARFIEQQAEVIANIKVRRRRWRWIKLDMIMSLIISPQSEIYVS